MAKSMYLVFCLLLAGCARLANGAAAAASVMEVGKEHPDLKRGLTLIDTTGDPELVTYLSDPKTVCTFFAPTSKAIQQSINLLGKNAGKAAQNETLQSMTFNYHLIPGKALTAKDLMQLNRTNTRANQTLYIMHRNGKPWLYSRPEYPVILKDTDIKAGKCIVHTVDMTLVPVKAVPQIQAWLDETGTAPPYPPLSEWAPIQDAYLQTYVDAELKKGSQPNTTAAAAAPAVASSSTSGAVAQQVPLPAVVTGVLAAATALFL